MQCSLPSQPKCWKYPKNIFLEEYLPEYLLKHITIRAMGIINLIYRLYSIILGNVSAGNVRKLRLQPLWGRCTNYKKFLRPSPSESRIAIKVRDPILPPYPCRIPTPNVALAPAAPRKYTGALMLDVILLFMLVKGPSGTVAQPCTHLHKYQKSSLRS